MSNFYGGKQGFSFYIAKCYTSIEEMNNNYDTDTDVNYNDYVLISSDDSSSIENGNLYRKGYQEYELIGNIAGPPGGVGRLELYDTINGEGGIIEAYEKESTDDWDIAPLSEKDIIITPEQVAGKADEEYNDNIKIGYYTLVSKTENNGKKIAKVKLAMQMPYPIIEMETGEAVNPGTNPILDRIDDGTHNYYYKYELKVPKGYDGSYFQPYLDSDYTLYAKKYVADSDGNYSEDTEGKINLGSLKRDTGILIGKNIAYYTNSSTIQDEKADGFTLLEDIPKIIVRLNSQYPDGLTDTEEKGKLVTYGDDEAPAYNYDDSHSMVCKWFFSYDYGTKSWYYIGSLVDSLQSKTILFADNNGSNQPNGGHQLNYGGVWFETVDN
jgi:hypothetical protein